MAFSTRRKESSCLEQSDEIKMQLGQVEGAANRITAAMLTMA